MAKIIKYSFIVATLILLMAGCKKDEPSTDTKLKLSFSTDTLIFDTIFTTIGSVTEVLKVYNPNSSDIEISSIELGNKINSNYTIKINGVNGTSTSNMLLRAKDSIYIFVKVTIDPTKIDNPLLVQDSIRFVTNTNIQQVNLVAWGQDAYFYKAKIGSNSILFDSSLTLANNKPHVFLSNVVVQQGVTITINKATRLHFDNNKGISFEQNSSLNINGTLGEEVLFTGIRLDKSYKNVPGQWSGIVLNDPNSDVVIDYATITNAQTGLTISNANNNPSKSVSISNTIIKNHSKNAIKAINCNLKGSNLVIANCGESILNLFTNGNYNFKHCTFVNLWNYHVRDKPIIQLGDSTKFYIVNSIVYGNLKEELSLKKNALYEQSLLTTKSSTPSTNLVNCLFNLDPKFINISINNFSLTHLSPAVNNGSSDLIPPILKDILGKDRVGKPDIGAYEFVE